MAFSEATFRWIVVGQEDQWKAENNGVMSTDAEGFYMHNSPPPTENQSANQPDR